MNKVKVLFLSANPINTERLRLDMEIREITDKIRASEGRDSLEIISRWAVRPDDLLQALNEHRPHIVHFSGHGNQAQEIIMEDKNGNALPVSKEALEFLFRTLSGNIQLVVLNACFSKPQAEVIAEIIGCTVGTNSSIGDEAAITFASAFYRAIGFGCSIQEAFDLGNLFLIAEVALRPYLERSLLKLMALHCAILFLRGKDLFWNDLKSLYEEETRSLLGWDRKDTLEYFRGRYILLLVKKLFTKNLASRDSGWQKLENAQRCIPSGRPDEVEPLYDSVGIDVGCSSFITLPAMIGVFIGHYHENPVWRALITFPSAVILVIAYVFLINYGVKYARATIRVYRAMKDRNLENTLNLLVTRQ